MDRDLTTYEHQELMKRNEETFLARDNKSTAVWFRCKDGSVYWRSADGAHVKKIKENYYK